MEFKDIHIDADADIKQVVKLAKLCFHEQSIDDKYYKKLVDLYLLGLFDTDQLVAAGGYYTFEAHIRGKWLKCAGVAHVMSDPIHRRQGHIRQIMTKLIQNSYTEGYNISSLWPFKHSFYCKFGYENVEKIIEYKFSPKDIKFDLDTNTKITIRVASEKDYPILNKIAKQAINKQTRLIGHHDAWFQRDKTDTFIIYIFEKEQYPVGFLSLKFNKPDPTKEWINDVHVIDFAYSDLVIKKKILTFLKNFDADIANIILYAPPEEEILSYLDEVQQEHKIARWPSMMRIINLKKTMETIPFSSNVNTVLYAEITDEIISANTGTWRFTIKEGNCKAERTNTTDTHHIQPLTISIGQLTQLVVGYMTVDKLFEVSSANVPDEWLDKDLFPQKPCWIGVWF